jgi:hypothetical protein
MLRAGRRSPRARAVRGRRPRLGGGRGRCMGRAGERRLPPARRCRGRSRAGKARRQQVARERVLAGAARGRGHDGAAARASRAGGRDRRIRHGGADRCRTVRQVAGRRSRPDPSSHCRTRRLREPVRPAGPAAHGDVQLPVDLARVVDRDDVGMLQRGRQLGLGQETFLEVRELGELRSDQLDRDDPLQAQVIRPVDDTHPPAARERLDPIAEKLSPDARVRRSFGPHRPIVG